MLEWFGLHACEEVCSLCCSAIVDGKDEALLCEGEQNCSRWMHRYCAGVSVNHFESFKQSLLLFNCSLCVQRKQTATIEELKSTIVALTAEMAKLRAALATQQHPVENNDANDQCKWSDVVARTRTRNQKANQSQKRAANKNSRATGAAGANVRVTDHQKAARVMVPGVRRVLGTRKEASPIYCGATNNKTSNENGL